MAREDLAASMLRLNAATTEARSRLSRLEEQARQDLAAGWEDLARFDLQQLHVAADELDALDQEAREFNGERRSLTVVEERMDVEVDGLLSREREIAATFNGVEAHRLVREKLGRIPAELASLLRSLKRLEQRAEDMHARASVIGDLVNLGLLDGADQADDVPHSSVEERLVALKREMGMA